MKIMRPKIAPPTRGTALGIRLRAIAPSGDEVVILGDVWEVDALLAYTVGPARLGAAFPVILSATSDLHERAAGLGDNRKSKRWKATALLGLKSPKARDTRAA